MCSSSTCVMKISFHHVIFFKKERNWPCSVHFSHVFGGNFYSNLTHASWEAERSAVQSSGLCNTDLVSILETQLCDSVDRSIYTLVQGRGKKKEKGLSGDFWVIQRDVLGAISVLVEHSSSPTPHTHARTHMHTHADLPIMAALAQPHVIHTRPSRLCLRLFHPGIRISNIHSDPVG